MSSLEDLAGCAGLVVEAPLGLVVYWAGELPAAPATRSPGQARMRACRSTSVPRGTRLPSSWPRAAGS